jgi:hypothetical protein
MIRNSPTEKIEKTRRPAAILATFVLLALSMPNLLARPTERRSTWDELSHTIPGTDVQIVLPDSIRVRGTAIEMGPDALVIEVRHTSNELLHAKGRTVIPRSDVSTIELFIRRSPGDHSVEEHAGAIGAGLGAVAVSPLLLRLGETDKISSGAAWVILIGAAVGGGIIANHIAHRHHANPNDVLITVVP